MRRVRMMFLQCPLLLFPQSLAFIIPRIPSGVFFRATTNLRSLENDDENNEDSQLQNRIQLLQQREQRQSALEHRNWDLGNWNQESMIVKSPVTAVVASADHGVLFLGNSIGGVAKLEMPNDTPLDPQSLVHWNVTTAPITAIVSVEEDDIVLCASRDGVYLIPEPADEDETAIATTLSMESSTETIIQSLFVVEYEDQWWIGAVRCCSVQLYALQEQQLRSVSVIDITTDKAMNDIDIGIDAEISSCAFDAERQRLYLGLNTGYVCSYDIQLEPNPPHSPTFRWVARWRINRNDTPITALAVGEDVLVNARQEMNVLFTGDASGHLQQWFLQESYIWPQRSSQRLWNRAHVFEGHSEAIAAIGNIDAIHFVSCSRDGTVRAWNAQTGKERFVLTGFDTTPPHMCLWDNVLATVDGKIVALHQFDGDTPEDFDLDMPEYRE